MGISLDGLVSGLDTTALIASLMAVETVPQNALKVKVSTTQTTISALQGLNTQIADLATLAEKTAKPQALDLYSASSSASNVKATTSAGAAAGTIDLLVNKLAQSQISVSAAMSVWPAEPAVLTIVGADGKSTEVTAGSTSLDDVAAAINKSGAGITATKVAVGADGFRLQFSSTVTGAAGKFDVYQGGSAQVTDGTASDLMAAAGAAVIRPAQDAQITLWAGTPAEQKVTSATNTFTDLLPGVAVSVSAVSAAPTTVNIARDDNQISSVTSGMISSIKNIFAVIANRSSVSSGTDANGRPTTTSGVFTGDSTIRDVSQKLLSAASLPVNGHSPSEMGISITKAGTMEFDATKFAAAMVSDPEGTKAAVQTIAGRVAEAAKQASDPYTGLITTKITGQQSDVKDLGNQISSWDDRLASREATLKKMYATMETQLSTLKSQGNWLTAQLAAPNTGN